MWTLGKKAIILARTPMLVADLYHMAVLASRQTTAKNKPSEGILFPIENLAPATRLTGRLANKQVS